MVTAAITNENLPALPADHNWHCAGCNGIVSTHFCADCDEIMPVYAWEEGVIPAYLPGSTFDGHPEWIERAARETNAAAGFELRGGRYVELIAPSATLDGLPVSVGEAAAHKALAA